MDKHNALTPNRFNVLRARAAMLAAALAGAGAQLAQAGTPAEFLAQFNAQATAQGQGPASAERGQKFFTTRHGRDWSCSSCHGAAPTGTGKHATTGKPIEPLAPAFNPQRFTDAAKVDKWFRRNCNDVVDRECSAAEKADVLAWLQTLKK